MKVVILAGGKGTRISEESILRPKPMIEIGGKPILWHIMKIYSYYGLNEFIICCGHKGQLIKKYFVNYYMNQSDATFATKDKEKIVHISHAEPWKVTLINTGLHTLTAGRILQIKDYIGEEDFLMTYGDGVSDVNINSLIDFHYKSGKMVTITTAQPTGRFGVINIDKSTNQIESFKEKSRDDEAWVNAGFMVMNKKVFDYLGDGSEMLEEGPFDRLVAKREMAAFKHNGFWQPMDMIRDKEKLEEIWGGNQAPWKIWN